MQLLWLCRVPISVPMSPPFRFLCSHLVELKYNSPDSPAESIVNLEEIGERGAVLESETPVQEGAAIELYCGRAVFAGRIVGVEAHEFGWRFEVEFSAQTPWEPGEFQPGHLLDAAALKWKS